MPENAPAHTPAAAPCLNCPKCGGDDVQLGEYVYRAWSDISLSDDGGTMIVSTSSDRMCWDASKDMAIYCNTCNDEFPVPDGLELDFV